MIKFGKNSSFTEELKNEVNNYFLENKITDKGTVRLYFKTVFWLLLMFSMYTLLVFFTPKSGWLQILECVVLGCSFAGIGFNIMHDASHGSYSKSNSINEFFAKTLNLLGANSDIWKVKHGIAHHTFVNTDHDDDINVAPLLKMSKNQKWYWWYRLQIGYMWILYAIEYIGWVLIFDFKKYFEGKTANTNIKLNLSQHWLFWLSKAFYFFIFLVIPIMRIEYHLVIYGYLIAGSVTGIIISIVFQLAHVQEKSSFPVAIPTDKLDVSRIVKENALHQMETTANFATKNKIISWLVGGLNFQIEHHLFPRISHVHYPAIQKIVKEVCAKYNVKYNEYHTFIGAFVSHVKHMWNEGKKPKIA